MILKVLGNNKSVYVPTDEKTKEYVKHIRQSNHTTSLYAE
jgi:hypothetical protein